MVDLTTTYMGMSLKNPLVVSSSPLSDNVDTIREMEEAGASAVVMSSLFEEKVIYESQSLDHYLNYGVDSFAESLSYFPDMQEYRTGPESYLNLISQVKDKTSIPIIGSLNGVSSSGWIEYAQKIEQAGADALELNIYYIPTDINTSGADIERMYLEVVQSVKKSVSIPVAVKLSPYFSATANMAHQLAQAGADALVLFNRFYQPDFDLENLEVAPNLVLSDSNELRLPLRWVAILHGQVPVDFAITSGVHTHEDVLKGLMAGAKVTMTASELLQNGVGRIGEILAGTTAWMEEREYESVKQMQGSMSQQHVAEPAVFERANYMKVLESCRPVAK